MNARARIRPLAATSAALLLLAWPLLAGERERSEQELMALGERGASPAPVYRNGGDTIRQGQSVMRIGEPPLPDQPPQVELAPASDLVCTLTGPGVPIQRYRLYSATTGEHLYTTSLNEYTVLGQSGIWRAEGSQGMILGGPTSRDGIAAVPFYRLYNPLIRQHLWTVDANEYNMLPMQGWRQEGIDGYLFPTPACGAVALYRLAYFTLHLWTTDQNEYNTLINERGWVGEGIPGYLFSGPLPEPAVCTRWKTDYPTTATTVWTGNTTPNACDLGVLNAQARADGLRRTNLYRYLVGLPDTVTENATYSLNDQKASNNLRGINTLTHTLPAGSTCYTPEGATGASSSNLAQGANSPAQAVDLYIGDVGVDVLGHRRWLLYPPFKETGFGFVFTNSPGVVSYSGQWVFGFGPDPAPAYVAYPAPPDFPFAALSGHWSFSVNNANFAAATVQVLRFSDGLPAGVTGTYVPTAGYGWNTIAWDINGAVAGETYQVTISNVMNSPQPTYTYTTTLQACP